MGRTGARGAAGEKLLEEKRTWGATSVELFGLLNALAEKWF
jgi:hypothetical protein